LHNHGDRCQVGDLVVVCGEPFNYSHRVTEIDDLYYSERVVSKDEYRQVKHNDLLDFQNRLRNEGKL